MRIIKEIEFCDKCGKQTTVLNTENNTILCTVCSYEKPYTNDMPKLTNKQRTQFILAIFDESRQNFDMLTETLEEEEMEYSTAKQLVRKFLKELEQICLSAELKHIRQNDKQPK